MKLKLKHIHSHFRRLYLHTLVDAVLVLEIAEEAGKIVDDLASILINREWDVVLLATRRLRRRMHFLPIPAKLGLVQGVLVPIIVFAFPSDLSIKHPFMVAIILWAASFSLALAIISFFPRPEHPKPNQMVHWL